MYFFGNTASLPVDILGAERKTLDSSGEIELAHFLTQTAVRHEGLGRQVDGST